jgi:hypothetical protein
MNLWHAFEKKDCARVREITAALASTRAAQSSLARSRQMRHFGQHLQSHRILSRCKIKKKKSKDLMKV